MATEKNAPKTPEQEAPKPDPFAELKASAEKAGAVLAVVVPAAQVGAQPAFRVDH